jgi:hypothetical protein
LPGRKSVDGCNSLPEDNLDIAVLELFKSAGANLGPEEVAKDDLIFADLNY